MTTFTKISNTEIAEAAEQDPQRALLMLLANSTLEEATKKSSEAYTHVPEVCCAGWSISIETPLGVVGLWSCWLEDQFYLGYPKEAATFHNQIEDLLQKLLGVVPAQPVHTVGATAVSEGYTGEYKDHDKPLEQNSCGQIVAYKTGEPRQWAKFYSERIPGKLGRVWVNHSEFDSSGHDFHRLSPEGDLVEIYYGHDRSVGVSTYRFGFCNKYAPEGPTTDPEVIQTYRQKFLALACAIADLFGGAQSVLINYGFVFVPEQLPLVGCSDVTWLRGKEGVREGWGEELVRASKGEETFFLRSGNSIVPWSTFRHIPTPKGLEAGQLEGYLVL